MEAVRAGAVGWPGGRFVTSQRALDEGRRQSITLHYLCEDNVQRARVYVCVCVFVCGCMCVCVCVCVKAC